MKTVLPGSPENFRLNWRMAALYVCFFSSGVAGLLYEVLWAKYLALYVGSTGVAQIIVLATFMGGLALGSEVLGRWADRVQSPLRMYAFLEFGIGVYAVFFEHLFSLGRAVFIAVARSGGITETGLLAGKIIACVMTILLPTFLMGGTLPALGRHMIRSLDVVGPRISRLYFLNSLGAVFGCLLAGFHFIRTFGLQFSMIIGAMLNVGVGVLALLVLSDERRRGELCVSAPPVGDKVAPHDVESEGPLPPWALRAILAATFVSGAVSMMYEVAWIRLLTLVLGSSTYAFSLMLATFILGLSMGSFLLSLRRNPRGYVTIFGLSEAAVGLTVLVSLPFYVRLPYWFNQLASSLSREPATFGLYQFCTFLMCALVMFVPTVLQGITFPAAVKVVASDLPRLGRRVGYVYAINTVGTLLGSVGAGFAGLPFLGIRGTLELAVALNGVVSLLVLSAVHKRSRRGQLLVGVLGITLAVWGWYAVSMRSWNREVLTAGIYRTRSRIPSYQALLKAAQTRSTVFYSDGVDATVSVEDITTPEPERLLVINGKVDASTRKDMPTQKLMAHVPLMVHPEPRKVFVVGIGSGATIGSVLAYDTVERVDVVELSRDIIRAAQWFSDVNGRFWEDPRVRIYWEDAKTFLQVTDEKYDVIISEPTNPWIAGIAGVFSREYFETCRGHLAPNGLFVQWFQTYELEDATFFMMLETLAGVFPHFTLWNPAFSDTVVIGSATPYGPNFDRMERRMMAPSVRSDLNQLGISGLLTLLGLQMADYAQDRPYMFRLGAQHSDYYPVLEYIAPRGFYIGAAAAGAKWIDARNESVVNARLWLHQYLRERELPPGAFESAHAYFRSWDCLLNNAPYVWADAWLRRDPNSRAAQLFLASASPPRHEEQIRALMAIGDEEGNEMATNALLLAAFNKYRDYEVTRTYLDEARAKDVLDVMDRALARGGGTGPADLWFRRGRVLYDLGRYAEAATSLIAAARMYHREERKNELLEAGLWLCLALLEDGRPADAASAFENILAQFDNDLRARLLQSRIAAANRR